MVERHDRALRAFGASLRQAKARRRLLWCGGLVGAGCAALLATSVIAPSPYLVWNASRSMPLGLYGVSGHEGLVVGDLVVARLPDDVAMLAAVRHYLPRGVPLVKDIAATGGQRVCGDRVGVTIDGVLTALRLPADRLGRPLPAWQGCHLLAPGEVFLLGRSPDSFDGRYFGPTEARDIVGRAVPLWLQ